MAQPNPTRPRQEASVTAVSPDDVSLIRGGPFYRAQQATRLISANRWNLEDELLSLLQWRGFRWC